jgi:L-threonylcarbamoyladenylate synthase
MIVKISSTALTKAVLFLKKGGVVICPTDTVYGFLADAKNKKAVDLIYKTKKRPKQKPLPVFVGTMKMAKQLADVDAKQEKVIKKYWPGKYTFVLKARKVPKVYKVYGVGKNTIALRIPKHPFLQKLLKAINRPLVQTSVNISGDESLYKMEDIVKYFGNNKNILIIDGRNLKKSKPSKIIDLTSSKIKRIR